MKTSTSFVISLNALGGAIEQGSDATQSGCYLLPAPGIQQLVAGCLLLHPRVHIPKLWVRDNNEDSPPSWKEPSQPHTPPSDAPLPGTMEAYRTAHSRGLQDCTP